MIVNYLYIILCCFYLECEENMLFVLVCNYKLISVL